MRKTCTPRVLKTKYKLAVELSEQTEAAKKPRQGSVGVSKRAIRVMQLQGKARGGGRRIRIVLDVLLRCIVGPLHNCMQTSSGFSHHSKSRNPKDPTWLASCHLSDLSFHSSYCQLFVIHSSNPPRCKHSALPSH